MRDGKNFTAVLCTVVDGYPDGWISRFCPSAGCEIRQSDIVILLEQDGGKNNGGGCGARWGQWQQGHF